MGLTATYVDIDTLTVSGDYTADFVVNRKIRADCGADGYKYCVVLSSSYAVPNTTVNLTAASDDLTANLTEVDWSVVKPGATGNIPLHAHTDENTGKQLDHGAALTGLGDDDHSIYALLAGRAGGQTLYGGNAANEVITIEPTSHATKTTAYVLLAPSGGAVGIGTTGPGDYYQSKLVIEDTANPTGLTIRSGTSSTVGIFFADGNSELDRYMGAIRYDHSTDALTIWTKYSTGGNVIFNPVGNVGIGTVFATGAPADRLTVAGGSATIYNTATLGSEKVSNGAFTTVPDAAWTWGTGWAHDTTNLEADHTAGNTAALEQGVSAVAGEIYQVVFTVKNRTAGSVTSQVGGVNGAAVSSNTTSTQQIRATGTGNLKFTPSSDFDGSIDDVSVKLIMGGDLKLAGLLTGGGTSGVKVTAGGNVGIGTTGPQGILEVSQSGTQRIIIRNPSETLSYDSMIGFYTGSGSPASSNLVGSINGIITQADPSALKSALDFWVNQGDSALRAMRMDSSGNVGIGTTDQFGGGAKVIGIVNAGTVPTTNPTGGGILYAEGGAGKWRGSSGTVTTFGPAEPHCPICGSDFVLEYKNPKWGHLIICMRCLAEELGKRSWIHFKEEEHA